MALGEETAMKVIEYYGNMGDRSDENYNWARIFTDEINEMFFSCPDRLIAR